MRFQLITLSGVKFDKEVYEVILPTASGHIAVFDKHQPLVSVVVAGVVTVVYKQGDPDNQREHFASEGGIIEVTKDAVRVLVDEAAHSSEVVEDEARKALERAYMMKDEAKDKVSLDHAQAVIDRESVRLKVAELRRHHRKKQS